MSAGFEGDPGVSAIRGIFGDIRWYPEGTLLRDAFPDERFDFVLAEAVRSIGTTPAS